MIIGITGASGFIGEALIGEILAQNNRAVGFSRSPDKSIEGCDEVRGFAPGQDIDLSGLDAVVHLAGESIIGLWTREKKREILNSRVDTTQRLVDAIRAMEESQRPKIFACASAVGIYGDRGDERLDEDDDAGFGFLSEVTQQWEDVATKAGESGVRTVQFRIGFVLGKNGGAVPALKKVFGAGLGGRLGSGNQWMPWVHVNDVAGIMHTSLENDSIRGPVNVTGPAPVRNREFTKVFADAVGRKAILPVPEFALKMMPGGMGEIFLNSQRVEPAAMKSISYQWDYPDLKEAIAASL